jgi:protease I
MTPGSHRHVISAVTSGRKYTMGPSLRGKRIAFVVANEGVEQVELTRPWEAVRNAGGEAHLVAPDAGKVQAFNHLDRADTFAVDRTTGEVSVDDYDGVVLPGGVANADHLRLDPQAVEFVGEAARRGLPIAVICHGAWALIEADVVRDHLMTSWPSLRTDLRNAGAEWVDRQVVVDDGLVSSRNPDDLDAFCTHLLEEFGREPASAASRSLTT